MLQHNFVTVKLQGRQVQCLVDTGASRSVISQKLLKLLNISELKLQNQNTVTLMAANNVEMESLGTIELDIDIQDLVIPHAFNVLRKLTHSCILGMDFLNANSGTIYCSHGALTLHDGLVTLTMAPKTDRSTLLCLTETVIIPARSEGLVPIRVHKKYRSQPVCIQTYPPLKDKLIAIAGAIIQPFNMETMCRIVNLAAHPRKIRAKTPIAQIMNVDFLDPINSVMFEKQHRKAPRTEINSITEMTIPPHHERVKALEEIGLDISQADLDATNYGKLTALLYEFKSQFAKDGAGVVRSNLTPHEIILTDETPIRVKQFRQPPHLQDTIRKHCQELHAANIIEPSDSAFNFPFFLIKKGNGSGQWRSIIDLRLLNKRIAPSYFPLPSIEEVVNQIGYHHPALFTTVDLASGFYQIPLTEKSKKFVAFSAGGHHWAFSALPQGLRSSPVAFMQSLSNLLASELDQSAILYLDDIIIHSRNFEEHMQILRKILVKFRDANLHMNGRKSHFCRQQLVFCGFLIGVDGVRINPSRFEGIAKMATPKNRKDIKTALGCFSYLRKFIRNFAKISEPMRRLLSNDVPFVWTTEQQESYDAIKAAILSETVLKYPTKNNYFINVDGSKHGIGMCLGQKDDDGSTRYISFNSRATKSYEKNYSPSELECSALCSALVAYHPFISDGREVEVFTDHMSLKWLSTLKTGSSKLARYSLLMSQYNLKITHIPGKNNQIADALSRLPAPTPEGQDMDETHVFDLHPTEYLLSMDVDAITNDCRKKHRSPEKARFREYYISSLTEPTNNTTEQEIEGENSEAENMEEEINESVKPRVSTESQKDCPHFEGIINFLQSGALPADKEKARSILFQAEFFTIQNDQLFRLTPLRGKRRTEMSPIWPRLCIPRAERELVLSTYHSLGHHGQIKMYETLRQKYYWLGLSTDVKLYIQQCETCQQIKNADGKPQHILTGLETSSLFSTIHIDHHQISLSTTAKQPYKYVLLVIDSFSREMALIPTKSTGAEEAGLGIWQHWITRHGFPKTIIGDRHRSWFSVFFKSLMGLGGYTKHSYTSARRPCANGKAEIIFKTVIKHVRSFCDGDDNWPKLVSAIELGHRCSVQSDLGISPFRCLYGQDMNLQLDLDLLDQPPTAEPSILVKHLGPQLTVLRKILTKNIDESRSKMETYHNKTRTAHSYKVGDRVWLQNDYFDVTRKTGLNWKHQKTFLGPYLILQVNSGLVKLMHFYTGKHLPNYINVDKLRALKDTSRDILYNRCQPQTRSGAADNETETIGTATNATLPTADNVSSIFHIGENKGKSVTPADNSWTGKTILKLTTRRISKPVAFYKTYFVGESEPQWVPADKLPVQLIIDFNVNKFQRSLRPWSAAKLNRMVRE